MFARLGYEIFAPPNETTEGFNMATNWDIRKICCIGAGYVVSTGH
jgi:hypothetical protein